MVAKRGVKKKSSHKSAQKKSTKHPVQHQYHPVFRQQLTFGERLSDTIADFGGSWKFIVIFTTFFLGWMFLNMYYLRNDGFDPYPFILLNLVLSCIAAFQAPIILMAQNRQGQRDRIDAKYDHTVNRKAEREIQQIQKELVSIRKMVYKMHSRTLQKIDLGSQRVVRKMDKK